MEAKKRKAHYNSNAYISQTLLKLKETWKIVKQYKDTHFKSEKQFKGVVFKIRKLHEQILPFLEQDVWFQVNGIHQDILRKGFNQKVLDMKLQSEVLPKLTLLPLTQQKLMHLRKQIQRVHSYAQLHRELTKITNIKIKKHSYELFDLIGGIKNVSLNLLWSHKQGMINESRDYQELHVFFSQMINPLLKETNQYLGQNLFALDEMKQKVQAMQSHLVSIISEIKRFTKVFDPNYNVDVQVGVPKDPDDEAEVEYFKDPNSFFATNSLPLSPPPDLRQRQRSSQRSPLLTQSQTHRAGQKGRNTDLRKSLDRVTMNNNNSPTNDFTITQRTNNTDIFNNIQTVKIKVIEAFHCQPSQFHSMFVILRADNQWKQTGLVSRAQKPVWNEIHTLLMSCREPLEITLMDQDKEGFDYFRGQCYLDIENLDQGQLLDLLIDLKDEDDEIAPEKLHLLFQRTPCNQIGIAKPEDEVNLFYPRQNQQKEPVKKKSRSKSKSGFVRY